MAARKPSSTNTRNREVLGNFCGINHVLNLVDGRWKLLILHKLEPQTRRFSELKNILPHITDRILTLQLRELEQDGLIARTVFAEPNYSIPEKLPERPSLFFSAGHNRAVN